MRSSYKGQSGVREWVADMRDAWERMEVRPFEIVDAGNPIVSLGHAHLRARELHFSDWDEALRAAGMNADPKVAGINPGIKLSDSQRHSETLNRHESTEPDLSA